jgi:DNA polymerase III epsilon subunit-like protein
MSIIIFDTETTGLPVTSIKGLEAQPHIVEFAAIKLEEGSLEEIDRLEFLVKPPIKMDEKVIKIHGIKNEDVENKDPFSKYYMDLVKFFFGTKYLIGHNISFDMNMLKFEMQRLGRTTQFPWCPIQICTMNQTKSLAGYNLNLSKLYDHLFKEEFKDAHRAMADVEALTRIVRKLVEDGVMKI